MPEFCQLPEMAILLVFQKLFDIRSKLRLGACCGRTYHLMHKKGAWCRKMLLMLRPGEDLLCFDQCTIRRPTIESLYPGKNRRVYEGTFGSYDERTRNLVASLLHLSTICPHALTLHIYLCDQFYDESVADIVARFMDQVHAWIQEGIDMDVAAGNDNLMSELNVRLTVFGTEDHLHLLSSIDRLDTQLWVDIRDKYLPCSGLEPRPIPRVPDLNSPVKFTSFTTAHAGDSRLAAPDRLRVVELGLAIKGDRFVHLWNTQHTCLERLVLNLSISPDLQHQLGEELLENSRLVHLHLYICDDSTIVDLPEFIIKLLKNAPNLMDFEVRYDEYDISTPFSQVNAGVTGQMLKHFLTGQQKRAASGEKLVFKVAIPHIDAASHFTATAAITITNEISRRRQEVELERSKVGGVVLEQALPDGYVSIFAAAGLEVNRLGVYIDNRMPEGVIIHLSEIIGDTTKESTSAEIVDIAIGRRFWDYRSMYMDYM